MRRLTVLLAIGLASVPAWAGEARSAKGSPKQPHVISIRFGFRSGMCYGYCLTELEIEPGRAILLTRSQERDKHRCPDLEVRSGLSDKRWKELIELVDRQALFALPESIGCPGCADQEVEGIEVRFSDRTAKGTSYNAGNAPKEIKALSEKLFALEQKLSRELPPVTLARCQM